MTSSSLLLHLHLLPHRSPSLLFPKFQTHSHLNSICKPRKFTISASSSNSSSSSWEREEIRWLREEQRWNREEKRWVREELRWKSEKESLLQEITNLKSQIQSLEKQNFMQKSSVPETKSSNSEVIEVLKEVDLSSVNQKQISETGSGPIPMMFKSEKKESNEMVVKEVRVLENSVKEAPEKKRKMPIKKGSEGEDVRALQEALLKLGFYSGEEDMEFSIFSSGTERAIKTWQASLSIPEDGIMTAELLEKLNLEQGSIDGNTTSTVEKESENGASVASVTEVSAIKQIVVKKKIDSEFEASHHRVFLLGENRWEDSSRLMGRDKQVGESTIGISTTKCISCRGEGRVLCTECDGTGEPNIEEQFMDWVDEGAKCPYCEGLGYNICDVCDGKTIITA
ncbi:disulfide isomerase pTAC5 protein [Thalictrum thalictroides]|uniref:Disulfide isomerase pTAC5 protein n=1 Tax=Thalictrum thalictroides TaxID=46969 RepID=A0A7J6W6H1_THATH|nr:disulfide isomerase pTAC5 protein [Thalictrum thalictroides]